MSSSSAREWMYSSPVKRSGLDNCESPFLWEAGLVLSPGVVGSDLSFRGSPHPQGLNELSREIRQQNVKLPTFDLEVKAAEVMRDMSVSPSRNSSLSSAEKKEDVYEENFYVRSQEDEKNEVKRKPLASRRPSNISPYENRMNNDIFMKRYAQNIDHEILEEERLARKRKSETPLRACNCKRSKCLKLYCECYAAGVFCFDCNCTACENTVPTTYKNFTKERITHADAGGTPTLPPPTGGSESSTCNKRKSHAKQRDGCNCKKSKCLKKYCECYEADGHCDEKCKCINCKNYPGSAELYAARTKHNKIIVSNNKLSDNLSENRRKKITPSPEFISNNNICGDDTIHKQIITPQPEQRYSFEKPQPKKYRVSQRKLRTAWLTTLNNGRSIALKNVKSIIHVVAKKEDACHAAQTVFDTIVARDTEQINQAKRIAIAAATEGTRAVSRKQLSKAEELCVAKAVGTATYSAVLDSIREEKLARAAGDWSQIAASTAREISILSENTDQTLDVQLEKSAISTVNSLASAWQPDEAKLAEEISINFSRIAAKFKSRATYLEKLALLLENPRNLESLAKRHNAFMTHADVRDGPPIQSGLGRIDRKPILIKIFQCLGNEDLFGASLVSQDWTNVAFDHKLWDFDFKAQLNISYSTSLLNSTSIDIPSPIRQKKNSSLLMPTAHDDSLITTSPTQNKNRELSAADNLPSVKENDDNRQPFISADPTSTEKDYSILALISADPTSPEKDNSILV